MTPAVSVCVPVFNGAPHIAQALRSVLDQTYTDFELVVVDNRSTDGTADIVRGLADERVRLVEADVHVDAAANFTRATGLARGRYVKLLCADDALAPRCLERQVAAFEAPGAEAVTLVAARRDLIDEEGRTVMRAHGLGRMTGRLAGPEAIRRVVRSGGNPLGEPAAVLMRGDALRAVGGW
jgi:glycosyltransferase involved in cell wall biosynthesis